MSVVIRLSGTGKTHAISYRIVATEKWSKRDGRYIEILGFYNPWQREGDRYKLDKVRYDYWLSKGAKASPTVLELIETDGKPKPKPIKVRPKKEAATAAAAQTPAGDQPAPVEAAKEETPAPEAPTETPVQTSTDKEGTEGAKPSQPSEPAPTAEVAK